MNWRVKGVVQKVLGAAPGGTRVNDLLQRAVGELSRLDRQIDGKVSDGRILMSHLARLDFPVRGARFFEIGTGWFPTIPVCLSLAGAGECRTFDLNRHLDRSLTFKMLAALERHLSDIAESAGRALPEVEEAYRRLCAAASTPELLRLAGINYRAPADATATDLVVGSVDVVFSNSVLEHVPPDAIAAMMRESFRVLRSGGIAVHSVNCGDHYAYFDRRITAINYLTYTDPAWRFWNNRLLYQNRLRPRDFLASAKAAGLEIVLEIQSPQPQLMNALEGMTIAPEFRDYPPEQLCCTSIDFVARKP